MNKLALLVLALLWTAAPAPAEDERPLWQKQADQAQKEHDARDLPGQEQKLRQTLADAREHGMQGKQLADILQQLGDVLHQQNHFPAALPVYQEALQLREKEYPADAPEVGKSLYGVGYCLHCVGNDADALPVLKRSLSIAEKNFGPESMEAYGPLAMMQVIYFGHDEQAARECAERTAAITKKQYPDDKNMAYATNIGLGIHRAEAGDYQGAMNAYREAQSIRKTSPADALPPDNLDEDLSRAEDRLFNHKPNISVVPANKPEWRPSPSADSWPKSPSSTNENPAQMPPATSRSPAETQATLDVGVNQRSGKHKYFVDGKEVSYNTYSACLLTQKAGDLIKSKSFEKARAQLQEALRLDSRYVPAQCAYGIVLAHLGKNDESIAAFKEAIAQKPNTDSAWMALAGVYEAKGMLDDALCIFAWFLAGSAHQFGHLGASFLAGKSHLILAGAPH